MVGANRVGVRHRLIGKVARLVWRIGKPRTIGVRALLLDRDERVALVRHSYVDQWYFPGGGVKKGESIDAALVRELAEEVAIADPVIERVLGVYHSRRGDKDDHIVIFVVRSAASGVLARADLREITGWLVPAGRPAGNDIAGNLTAHRRIPAGCDRHWSLVTRKPASSPYGTIKTTMCIA